MADTYSIAMLAACPFPTHQGTQVLIRHLATTLATAGHEVHLITYGYGEWEQDFPFHLHRASTPNMGLRSGPHPLKPAADAALLLTAMRVVRTYRCQLLHAHNIEGLGIGAVLKLQTACPLVYHAHNAMGPELPTYFRVHLAQAFAGVVGELLDRTLPRVADAVVVFDVDHQSNQIAHGVAPHRVHVIPPGIDASEINAPAKSQIHQLRDQLGPGPCLLYAGNPDAYQNLSLLYTAFGHVRAHHATAKLVLATSHDPESFARELRGSTHADGIVIHRYRTLKELQALFALADVGLSPRTLWAGSPVKVLNYMAAGLPVVACRSGARHMLAGDAGLLVDDNAEAFAAGILEVLEQPIRPPPTALDRFRIDTHAPLYEAAYSSVLRATADAARDQSGAARGALN